MKVLVSARNRRCFSKKRLTRQYNAVFWSLTAWIATSAVILATAPKTSAEFVFTQFTNETGWPDGVAWMLGLLQSALSLIGYDAITHMTEEMPRPTRDAPIAMVTCVAIGGVT